MFIQLIDKRLNFIYYNVKQIEEKNMLKQLQISLKKLKRGDEIQFTPHSFEDKMIHSMERLGLVSPVRNAVVSNSLCVNLACCNTGIENFSKPIRWVIEALPI